MFAGVQNHEAFFFLTVPDLTARNNMQPRRWGMSVQVTEDANPANNVTWVLTRGVTSTDINDNNNWQISTNQIGGSSGALQYNNNGSLGGIPNSSWANNILTLPAEPNSTPRAFRLKDPNTNNWMQEHCSYLQAYSGGALSANVLQGTALPASSTLVLEVMVLGTQTSGTKAATGFSMKIRAAFKIDAANLFTIIGASVQEWVLNDTGDAFVGTPALAASGEGGNINLNLNLTTVKTFQLSIWSKLIINS